MIATRDQELTRLGLSVADLWRHKAEPFFETLLVKRSVRLAVESASACDQADILELDRKSANFCFQTCAQCLHDAARDLLRMDRKQKAAAKLRYELEVGRRAFLSRGRRRRT